MPSLVLYITVYPPPSIPPSSKPNKLFKLNSLSIDLAMELTMLAEIECDEDIELLTLILLDVEIELLNLIEFEKDIEELRLILPDIEVELLALTDFEAEML